MTTMNETVRDALKTQGELAAKVTAQAFELQLEATKLAGKQIAATMDTARAALETQARATRAMQDTFLAGLTPAEAPKA